MGKQRGINRVVVGVWDFEAGQRFYEQLLGACFESENDDGEAAAFGVRVAMAWDAGIELVSPIDGVDSYMRTELERNGEGVKGVVFAVDDADASMGAATELGLSTYHSLDYCGATRSMLAAAAASTATRSTSWRPRPR